jgi:hypothetical protein
MQSASYCLLLKTLRRGIPVVFVKSQVLNSQGDSFGTRPKKMRISQRLFFRFWTCIYNYYIWTFPASPVVSTCFSWSKVCSHICKNHPVYRYTARTQLCYIIRITVLHSWSQWPRALRRRSAAARLLRSWVRIPQRAWMFVCCECCVLSGRGLCDELIPRPEESYRLWCVVVCDLETSRIRRSWPALGRSATEKKLYYIISIYTPII